MSRIQAVVKLVASLLAAAINGIAPATMLSRVRITVYKRKKEIVCFDPARCFGSVQYNIQRITYKCPANE